MGWRLAYNFRPEFPDSTVDRYPSLSQALGDHYPGVRFVAPSVHPTEPSNSPSNCVENAPTAANSRPHVPAAEERMSVGEISDISVNNANLVTDSFPVWGQRSPHGSEAPPAFGTSFSFDDSIPIRNRPLLNPIDAPSDAEYCQRQRIGESNNSSQDGYPPDLYPPFHGSTNASAEAAHDKAPWLLGCEHSIPPIPPNSLVETPNSINLPELGSSLAGASSASPSAPSTHNIKRAGSGSMECHRLKVHECSVCHVCFARPSELRTHKNKHTGEQPFACDFPGCRKRFGVSSNLQRHRVAHGVERSARDRPIEPYEVRFEAPLHGPSVTSDTTSMSTDVLWDNEGPFSRRATRFSPPQAETSRGTRECGRGII